MHSTTHYIHGKNGALALLRSKTYPIKEILISKDSFASNDTELNTFIQKSGYGVTYFSKQKFNTRFQNKRTQGIVIKFEYLHNSITEYEFSDDNICFIVLDGINDPQNLGQIIRTAECAGVNGIILPSRKTVGITDSALQVSQGAFCNLDLCTSNNINDTLDYLKNHKFWVTGFENSITSKFWHEIDYNGRVVLIFGGEGSGIRKLVKKNCDSLATIPMNGKTNSLNVSSTVSAVLFERNRQLLL